MAEEQSRAKRRRLAWQCRRGMRELDLLLIGFLERDYDRLPAEDRAAFETLLGYPDPILIGVLLGRATPTDPRLAELAARIRRAAGGDAPPPPDPDAR